MLLLCTNFYAEASTITSTILGGNWNDPTTWVGGIVPRSTDDVVIAANTTVLLDAADVMAGILSLNVSAGSVLQVSPLAVNNIRFYIKGNIVNNGSINFWLSSTQGAGLTLTGNSNWSGTGTWNLAQLFIGNFALEFSADLSININRSITVGSGSLNSANKRSNINFTLSGPENITLASASSGIFYGNISVDKNSNSYGIFAVTGTTSVYNTINILGNLTLNYGNELKVANYNVLDIRNNLSGSGKVTGGTSSDIQISGNGASILFNSGGSGFRNFTVTRPAGATIDSTITINQTLSLQNQCKLYLPAGKSANGNQSFSVGTVSSTGAIIGDGFLAQQPWTNAFQLADLTINGTASTVNLRFSQSTKENTIRNLSINKSTGIINLLDGGLLQVRNTFTLTNGNFSIGSGTLKLSGSITTSASGTLSGSANANLIIDNEVSTTGATLFFNQTDAASRALKTYTQSRNGTITLANPVDVYNLVDLNSNNAANILNSASNLTLISNETGTARVNNMGLASISDSVFVQRFIKGSQLSRRGYRLLSSPVSQVDAANKSLRRYYFSRIQDQILITGSGGAGNGFDASSANGPTIWKYNEPAATSASQDFIPISKINKLHSVATQDYLTNGNGFLLFFRGDRINNLANKTTAPFPVPEDVVISFKGLLNQGNITVTAPFGAATGSLSYTNKAETNDGFNLVGNPYASAIDWELSGGSTAAIALTNINPTIYIFDPVTKNYGTYTKGGMYTGSATRYIASGQGFFVKANAVNPAITFTEAGKATDNSNPSVLGGNTVFTIDFLRLKLQKDSLNTDDILFTFKAGQHEDFSQEEDVADLPGMNASVSLSALIKAERKQLAVNALPAAIKVKQLPLFVDAAANGSYQLTLTDFSENFKNAPVYLKDNFKKDSVDLRLRPNYPFFIDRKDSTSFGGNRFVIVFSLDSVVKTNTITAAIQVKQAVFKLPLAYPNPAATEINFLSDKRSIGDIRLNIYNETGTKVQSAVKNKTANFKQNVADLPPGIYIAELLDTFNGSRLQTVKFIKK